MWEANSRTTEVVTLVNSVIINLQIQKTEEFCAMIVYEFNTPLAGNNTSQESLENPYN